MRQLAEELWVADAPLRFLGLQVGARMTAIRLADSRLLLHSPISPSEELVAKVRALGTVAYLVAPNRLHHLFVAAWQQLFPQAALYVAPGLDRKRPDLHPAGVLSDRPEPGWATEVDQALVQGLPFTSEVVFFHLASRTLIVSDLAFNIRAGTSPFTRLVLRAGGTLGRLAPTLLERLMVRDRPAFRRSLERILAWPFERVVVAHGEVCETDAREQLQQGYSWILRRVPAGP